MIYKFFRTNLQVVEAYLQAMFQALNRKADRKLTT